MKLRVAKWGNSLAVRLPVECIDAAGLKEGDSVEAEVNATGHIELTPLRPFNKETFLSRVRKLQADMSMTDPVVEQMRREDKY